MFNQKFHDQQLQCVDCSQQFTFNAEDQKFYYQKIYSNPKDVLFAGKIEDLTIQEVEGEEDITSLNTM